MASSLEGLPYFDGWRPLELEEGCLTTDKFAISDVLTDSWTLNDISPSGHQIGITPDNWGNRCHPYRRTGPIKRKVNAEPLPLP